MAPINADDFILSAETPKQHDLHQKQQPQQQQQKHADEPQLFKIKLTSRDKELLKKLDMEHQKKVEAEKVKREGEKIAAVPNPKSRQKVIGGDVVTSAARERLNYCCS